MRWSIVLLREEELITYTRKREPVCRWRGVRRAIFRGQRRDRALRARNPAYFREGGPRA